MKYIFDCHKCSKFKQQYGDFISCDRDEYTLMIPIIANYEVACPDENLDNQ